MATRYSFTSPIFTRSDVLPQLEPPPETVLAPAPALSPPPEPAADLAPAPRLRPRACPVGVGRSGGAGAAGSAGLPGAGGGVTGALAREITVSRGASGLLEPLDSYSRGVIQGLQRALFAFAVSRGRGVVLIADGVLSRATVAMTISAIAEIGLPPNVSPAPRTDVDIARHCRAYANHIAAAAGAVTDFQPVSTSTLRAEAQTASSPEPQPPAKLFSGRNITIGAALFGGFALLRR